MSTHYYSIHPDITDSLPDSSVQLLNLSWAQYSREWNSTLHTHPHTELFFADAGEEWKQYPVSMLYNAKKGYIDSTLGCILETDMPGEEILFTYGKKLPDSGAKAHLPVVKRCRLGKGSLVLSALSLDGRVGANAGLDALLSRLMEERGEQSQTA